ncbi:MAG: hypothetical protein NWE80_03620 [Candidatus Bathyarchaeota archaeon]|nr:hypothetical protein [Candidatus Bathyarchaeota archaeon]
MKTDDIPMFIGKKRILLYGIPAIVLILSTAYLLLPMEKKLRLFCVLDDAHLAEEEPIWVQGYWRARCPQCGLDLTEFVIYTGIDAGMSVLYCNSEDIFWIVHGWGPMKVKFYGPYQGSLWELANTLNVVAVFGIIFSVIAFLLPLMHRALIERPQKRS